MKFSDIRIPKPRKVVSKIQFSCGCGHPIRTEQEALFHSQVTGHCISVKGEVKCL